MYSTHQAIPAHAACPPPHCDAVLPAAAATLACCCLAADAITASRLQHSYALPGCAAGSLGEGSFTSSSRSAPSRKDSIIEDMPSNTASAKLSMACREQGKLWSEALVSHHSSLSGW